VKLFAPTCGEQVYPYPFSFDSCVGSFVPPPLAGFVGGRYVCVSSTKYLLALDLWVIVLSVLMAYV